MSLLYEFLRDNLEELNRMGARGWALQEDLTFEKMEGSVRYWIAEDEFLFMVGDQPLCPIPKDSSDTLSHKLRLKSGEIKLGKR